jgi:hypothetical protein
MMATPALEHRERSTTAPQLRAGRTTAQQLRLKYKFLTIGFHQSILYPFAMHCDVKSEQPSIELLAGSKGQVVFFASKAWTDSRINLTTNQNSRCQRVRKSYVCCCRCSCEQQQQHTAAPPPQRLTQYH